MNRQQRDFPNATAELKKNQPFNLRAFIIRCLYYWPVFIIALVICSIAGFLYMKRSHPAYLVKATLVINDNKKAPGQDAKLEELDLSNSSKVLENEIEILKSNQLIGQMVRDLQLWTTYQKKGDLVKTGLYKTAPVKIITDATAITGRHEIDIVVKDASNFYIKNPGGNLRLLKFNNTYHSEFGSWRLLPAASLPMFKGATIAITMVDPDVVTLDYQKLIDVNLSNKLATAVVLSVEDQNAQRGKDILNQLITDYNLAGRADKNQQAEKALYFINKRLDSLSHELNKAEKGIAGFKSNNGLTDISNDAQVSLDDRQDNARRLNEVTVQLTAIESIERYVNANQNAGGAPSLQGITDASLTGLVKTLSDLQLQREKLLATTPETNPDFEQLNRQIARTKAEIKDNVKSIQSSLLSTKQKLQSFNSGFKSSIKDIPFQERELTSKKRTQSSIENLYTYLLQKKEELSVNYASTLSNAHVVDAAYAGLPKAPTPLVVYGAALLLGLGLPAGFIYLMTLISSAIITPQQIRDKLRIPIIIELPLDKLKKQIAVSPDSITGTTEQFRALRTKLYHLYANRKQGRVTLITSSTVGEGKNFVSANLAAAIAYTGKRVVLVDLNMRGPGIAGLFKLSADHPGVADFIAGMATTADLIQSSALVPKLNIITCGAVTQNPSELLEQEGLEVLFFQLRETYDDIIINTPPLHMFPDAMIASRVADVTLYIIRQGLTAISELDFIKELYEGRQLPSLNLIFNGINRKKYGYGYNYAHVGYAVATAERNKALPVKTPKLLDRL